VGTLHGLGLGVQILQAVMAAVEAETFIAPAAEDDLELLGQELDPIPSGGKGKPYAACSRSCHPAPSPTSMRPPEMWSAVMASLARFDGCRKVAGETIVPSRNEEVTAARPHTVPHASSAPRLGCSPSRFM
jgi:hypothetical protein